MRSFQFDQEWKRELKIEIVTATAEPAKITIDPGTIQQIMEDMLVDAGAKVELCSPNSVTHQELHMGIIDRLIAKSAGRCWRLLSATASRPAWSNC